MRLTTNELELIHEALACFEYEADQALEIDYNNEAVCRWARETINMIRDLTDKLVIVIESIKNLEQKDVESDIILTPRIKPVEYKPTFSNPSSEV